MVGQVQADVVFGAQVDVTMHGKVGQSILRYVIWIIFLVQVLVLELDLFGVSLIG